MNIPTHNFISLENSKSFLRKVQIIITTTSISSKYPRNGRNNENVAFTTDNNKMYSKKSVFVITKQLKLR